jgi:hypothetical protein
MKDVARILKMSTAVILSPFFYVGALVIFVGAAYLIIGTIIWLLTGAWPGRYGGSENGNYYP